MRQYFLTETNRSHLRELARVLRPEDAEEIRSFGWTPQKALWRSYRASIISRTAFVDGEIALIYGVGGNPLAGRGMVWLMTAPPVERMPVSFIREGRRQMEAMLDIFPVISGVVSVARTGAIRFLNSLGFYVPEAIVLLGPNKMPFRTFVREREELIETRMIEEAIRVLGPSQKAAV